MHQLLLSSGVPPGSLVHQRVAIAASEAAAELEAYASWIASSMAWFDNTTAGYDRRSYDWYPYRVANAFSPVFVEGGKVSGDAPGIWST